MGLSGGCTQVGKQPAPRLKPDSSGVFHVYPGSDIQEALEAAAGHQESKTVHVHAGIYAPRRPNHALIWLNARHDGIQLEAVGDVVLTAANADLADPKAGSYPAVVNHVVYFGDGSSRRTTLRGFTITGANGFSCSPEKADSMEPNLRSTGLVPGLFFFTDGGAIKVFGRSSPSLIGLTIRGNSTSVCAGGISIEQRGLTQEAVLIKDCVFQDNHCPGTGAAVDVLSGGSAIIENCLFVGNISNTGMEEIALVYGLTYNPQHGCGALTVFPESAVEVRRCTFTENWNGVDDRGIANVYESSIFWKNQAGDGSRPGAPYEMDISDASNVSGCYLNGEIVDLQGTLDPTRNVMEAPEPQFDAAFVPLAGPYKDVGYRPVGTRIAPKP